MDTLQSKIQKYISRIKQISTQIGKTYPQAESKVDEIIYVALKIQKIIKQSQHPSNRIRQQQANGMNGLQYSEYNGTDQHEYSILQQRMHRYLSKFNKFQRKINVFIHQAKLGKNITKFISQIQQPNQHIPSQNTNKTKKSNRETRGIKYQKLQIKGKHNQSSAKPDKLHNLQSQNNEIKYYQQIEGIDKEIAKLIQQIRYQQQSNTKNAVISSRKKALDYEHVRNIQT